MFNYGNLNHNLRLMSDAFEYSLVHWFPNK
ncbi:hypothetical protein MIZ01_1672 [Sideroxyarcus emersonii]|uniref:Uncharacterized protein n=1 Tax=Sideroxyarcus emersonii TaxID=2764705 RepID=A0AAN1XAD0_9PROT|nr:hypothetical protein MIZ01_1672 [Sideroxyarcus emersonii]